MHNPLDAYRRTQRELRRHFETFTRANCPSCPTPCCRRPARIAPTDILLAEATGWRAQVAAVDSGTASSDLVAETAVRLADALRANDSEEETLERVGEPCEFLGAHGCTFPTDLRPYGCTAYVCRFMYERLDRKSLTRVKRLVRELEERHTELLRSVRRVRWNDARDEP